MDVRRYLFSVFDAERLALIYAAKTAAIRRTAKRYLQKKAVRFCGWSYNRLYYGHLLTCFLFDSNEDPEALKYNREKGILYL